MAQRQLTDEFPKMTHLPALLHLGLFLCEINSLVNLQGSSHFNQLWLRWWTLTAEEFIAQLYLIMHISNPVLSFGQVFPFNKGNSNFHLTHRFPFSLLNSTSSWHCFFYLQSMLICLFFTLKTFSPYPPSYMYFSISLSETHVFLFQAYLISFWKSFIQTIWMAWKSRCWVLSFHLWMRMPQDMVFLVPSLPVLCS